MSPREEFETLCEQISNAGFSAGQRLKRVQSSTDLDAAELELERARIGFRRAKRLLERAFRGAR